MGIGVRGSGTARRQWPNANSSDHHAVRACIERNPTCPLLATSRRFPHPVRRFVVARQNAEAIVRRSICALSPAVIDVTWMGDQTKRRSGSLGALACLVVRDVIVWTLDTLSYENEAESIAQGPLCAAVLLYCNMS